MSNTTTRRKKKRTRRGSPRADEGAATDRHPAQDGAARADGGAALHERGFADPVLICGHGADSGGGSRAPVVDERHVVPDEHFVLDGDAFANEAVAGDLAAPADAGSFLYFDEGADLGLVADRAAVKVSEGVDGYAVSELDVVGDEREGRRVFHDLGVGRAGALPRAGLSCPLPRRSGRRLQELGRPRRLGFLP